MKTMRLLAVLAFLAMVGAAPALKAQMGQPKEKPKAEGKEEGKEGEGKEGKEGEGLEGEDETTAQRFAKLFKDLDQVTGKTEVTEDDVKLVLKHHEEIDGLTKDDAEFDKVKDQSLKAAYEYMLKSDKYKAWAKEKGQDPEKFLKVFMRVFTNAMKMSLEKTFKQLTDSFKEYEDAYKKAKDAGEMDEEEYKQGMKMLADAKADFENSLKELKKIPGPTEAEAKIFKTHEKELAKMAGMDDEEGEAEDGMDG
ncbi:MAG: hypothetical protein KF754_05495 [Planctomycetes bacterium]|nr:hypothetical protein [Planctomycetota bacterium]